MAEFTIERVQFLPLLMSACIFISATVPYIVSVILSKVQVFLPYISHASAFPPHSALLSIFMTIAAVFGVPTFLLRFAAVDQKTSRLDPKKIKVLNVIAVVIGMLAHIVMILASHYPLGFVTHHKHDWLKYVVIPHFSGTSLLLTTVTIYVLIQAYLTYVHRKKTTRNVFSHAALAMCVVITNWTSCVPFYAAIREILPRIIDDETGEINLEYTEYNFYYIISSLSEWAFTFFCLLFISTFYFEFKNMTLKIKITPKTLPSVNLDSVEAGTHQTFNGREEITKM